MTGTVTPLCPRSTKAAVQRQQLSALNEEHLRGSMQSESSPPRRLKRDEARASLPEELRPIFDQLCEETHYWSQYYYGSTLISYSILKELVRDGWVKSPGGKGKS